MDASFSVSSRNISEYIQTDLSHNHTLHTSHITLLGSNLKVSVDNSNSQKDTSSRAKSTHQIRSNREGTNASTTESGRSWNNALQLLVHALLAVTSHDKSLVLKLLSNIAWGGARNLNPSLGEDGAGNQHVGDVDGGVDRVEERIGEVQWWRHVVCDTRGSEELSRTLLGLPGAEKTDEKVIREAGVEHLRDKEDVGGEGGLQHDWHVGGVEQADWVGAAGTTLTGGLDWDLDAEALEVDDGGEDGEGSEQVGDVWEVLAVESLVESALLVWPGEEEVDECDNGTLELWATAGVDGGWGESLPDNGLADIGGNEEGNSASKTVTLLEELIEENDDQASNDELEDEEENDTGAEVRWLSVKTSEDVDGGLPHGQNDGEQLLSSLVELAIGLQVEVDVDEVGTSKELEDHAGGDNWGNTQFHESTSVGGHHHTEPVQWIRGVGRDNAVQWHLAHDQEDQESQAGPHELLVEWDLCLWLLNLWKERREWLDQIKKADFMATS